MKKRKEEITIRSSAAEYLTYVASVGGRQDSIEIRYEDENIWLTQKTLAMIHNAQENNENIKKNDTKFRITKERSGNYMENCTKKTYNISIGTDKIPSS